MGATVLTVGLIVVRVTEIEGWGMVCVGVAVATSRGDGRPPAAIIVG